MVFRPLTAEYKRLPAVLVFHLGGRSPSLRLRAGSTFVRFRGLQGNRAPEGRPLLWQGSAGRKMIGILLVKPDQRRDLRNEYRQHIRIRQQDFKHAVAAKQPGQLRQDTLRGNIMEQRLVIANGA